MPKTVRDWLLEQEIGRDAVSVTFRDRHRNLSGEWTVKVYQEGVLDREAVREAFIREGVALASVQHPNLLRIQVPFVEDKLTYCPMEWVSGRCLDVLIHEGPPRWTVDSAARILVAAAEGVGEAHRQNPPIVHRDLRPEMIRVMEDGLVKVGDFCLGQTIDERSVNGTVHEVWDPRYTSPEVLGGKASTVRSDVYSLGLILYRMLAGRLPFDLPKAKNVIGLIFALHKAHGSGLVQLRDLVPEVPVSLAGLVMDSIGPAAGRPENASVFAEKLAASAGVVRTRMPVAHTEDDETRIGLSVDAVRKALGMDPLATSAAGADPVATTAGSHQRPIESGGGMARPAPVPAVPSVPFSRRIRQPWVIVTLVTMLVVAGGIAFWRFFEVPRRQKAAIDSADCDKARGMRDRGAWASYLGAHAKGICAVEAATAIKDIDACALARKNADAGSWKEYSKSFPSGICKTEATSAIQAGEQLACKTARAANTSKSWRSYLDANPAGVCIDEAKRAIQDLAACDKARSTADIALWKAYLDVYPEGTCHGEAETVLHVSTRLIKWIEIPGGRFEMGSRRGGDDDGMPRHEVTVPTFLMAKTEVTVEQYRACVGAGVCSQPGAGDKCNWGVSGRDSSPVNCVTWHQARVFAKWVGGRLPSEAEWEYAARSAGKDQEYPWGDTVASCAFAIMDDANAARGQNRETAGCGAGTTSPVCSRPDGNSLQGVCDLAGNVWEWTEDCWHESYTGAPADHVPWTAGCQSGARVWRGGSCLGSERLLRSTFRFRGDPGNHSTGLGFRTVRSGPP